MRRPPERSGRQGPRPERAGPRGERAGPPHKQQKRSGHGHGHVQGGGEASVVGKHAVEAVLRFQRERAQRLYLQERTAALSLEALAKERAVPVQIVDANVIGGMAGADQAHQGCVLLTGPFPYETVDGLDTAPPLTLVLDGVEDPRNLGAAARAAYALGASLLVVPSDRAASCTAAAYKASAGALARIPVARETNLRRALDILKEKGAWIVGAEADGRQAPWQVDLKGQIALVIGGEDSGLRRLTREACDHVVSIPMPAPDMSLNAADAATVLLYEALRQRSG